MLQKWSRIQGPLETSPMSSLSYLEIFLCEHPLGARSCLELTSLGGCEKKVEDPVSSPKEFGGVGETS